MVPIIMSVIGHSTMPWMTLQAVVPESTACAIAASVEGHPRVGRGLWRDVFKTQLAGDDVAVKRLREHKSNFDPTFLANRLMASADYFTAVYDVLKEASFGAEILAGSAKHLAKHLGYCRASHSVVVEWGEELNTQHLSSLELTAQMSTAVAELHGFGILHTDIKLDNFLVRAHSAQVFLNDFHRAAKSHSVCASLSLIHISEPTRPY
eukprot:TRINITY_DN15666_c0_g1_i3.p1 TRINITY_DN15666_c0_g1~~TRINITY_DN15666_c0_g1_i3.p1  ORF type:complete len:208 (+),score=32.06 TRINITY_DN15666_c0_g1_i3:280-903(+)